MDKGDRIFFVIWAIVSTFAISVILFMDIDDRLEALEQTTNKLCFYTMDNHKFDDGEIAQLVMKCKNKKIPTFKKQDGDWIQFPATD